jgi:hypothetical protein
MTEPPIYKNSRRQGGAIRKRMLGKIINQQVKCPACLLIIELHYILLL